MIQLIAGCMAFHSVFSKTKLKFKMWFLLDLSIKFRFQMLHGCGNASRRDLNRWTLELWCLNSSIHSKIQGYFRSRRTVLFKEKKRHNRPIKGRLTIDGNDGASFSESMLLFDDRPIADEGSRCIFIAWRRKCVDSLWALDLHRAVLIDLKVHLSWRISL